MKSNILITLILLCTAALTACNSGDIRRNPGKNFAPDMFYSRAADAFTHSSVTKDSLTSQLPVEGTIARGQALPTHLTAADTAKYAALKNPYTFSEEDLDKGRVLYNIQCGICHGTKLDGQGPLYTSGKFAAMPANFKSDKLKAFTGGRMLHTIVYGFNAMGSYAAQLNDRERWLVISYIESQVKGGDTATEEETKNEEEK